jgi:hypothetical protein
MQNHAVGRYELVDLAQRLVREHESVLPASSVIGCLARCRDELVGMGVREGLLPAVEAMARRRLRGLLMTLSVPALQAVGT